MPARQGRRTLGHRALERYRDLTRVLLRKMTHLSFLPGGKKAAFGGMTAILV